MFSPVGSPLFPRPSFGCQGEPCFYCEPNIWSALALALDGGPGLLPASLPSLQVTESEPSVMWLSGLHIPESYLTALVQATCRRNNWPLDRSTLFTQVTKFQDADEVNERAGQGTATAGMLGRLLPELSPSQSNERGVGRDGASPCLKVRLLRTAALCVHALRCDRSEGDPCAALPVSALRPGVMSGGA